jgi:hypothetical protein
MDMMIVLGVAYSSIWLLLYFYWTSWTTWVQAQFNQIENKTLDLQTRLECAETVILNQLNTLLVKHNICYDFTNKVVITEPITSSLAMSLITYSPFIDIKTIVFKTKATELSKVRYLIDLAYFSDNIIIEGYGQTIINDVDKKLSIRLINAFK